MVSDETQKPQQAQETSSQETTPLIKEAKETAERLEKANAEHKALLDREEQMKARAILSGKAEAGILPVIPDKEEEANKAAMSLLEGTGLNPFKNAKKT